MPRQQRGAFTKTSATGVNHLLALAVDATVSSTGQIKIFEMQPMYSSVFGANAQVSKKGMFGIYTQLTTRLSGSFHYVLNVDDFIFTGRKHGPLHKANYYFDAATYSLRFASQIKATCYQLDANGFTYNKIVQRLLLHNMYPDVNPPFLVLHSADFNRTSMPAQFPHFFAKPGDNDFILKCGETRGEGNFFFPVVSSAKELWRQLRERVASILLSKSLGLMGLRNDVAFLDSDRWVTIEKCVNFSVSRASTSVQRFAVMAHFTEDWELQRCNTIHTDTYHSPTYDSHQVRLRDSHITKKQFNFETRRVGRAGAGLDDEIVRRVNATFQQIFVEYGRLNKSPARMNFFLQKLSRERCIAYVEENGLKVKEQLLTRAFDAQSRSQFVSAIPASVMTYEALLPKHKHHNPFSVWSLCKKLLEDLAYLKGTRPLTNRGSQIRHFFVISFRSFMAWYFSRCDIVTQQACEQVKQDLIPWMITGFSLFSTHEEKAVLIVFLNQNHFRKVKKLIFKRLVDSNPLQYAQSHLVFDLKYTDVENLFRISLHPDDSKIRCLQAYEAAQNAKILERRGDSLRGLWTVVDAPRLDSVAQQPRRSAEREPLLQIETAEDSRSCLSWICDCFGAD